MVGYQAKGRRSHCAVNVGTNVIFFGGYNALHKQHFGDMFSINTGVEEKGIVTSILSSPRLHKDSNPD